MERDEERKLDVPRPGSIFSPRTPWRKVLHVRELCHGAESICRGTFLTSHHESAASDVPNRDPPSDQVGKTLGALLI
jgi:hypothetical protein